MKRLNLGAGHDIMTEWINHDLSPLPKIDIAHDLNEMPWPWENNEFDEVLARDVLEHLSEFVPAMEELWRIMKTGAILTVRVPYMGSWSYFSDPTHKRAFHETTFSHFDPSSPYCGDRSYYSTARFQIETYSYVLAPFVPLFVIPGIGEFKVWRKWSKLFVGFIGIFLVSNLIQCLEIRMRKVM